MDNAAKVKKTETTIDSLLKTIIGSMVFFVAMVLGIGFNFFTRVIIARFYSPGDYGLFNLYFVILSIFALIGTLGFELGITRYIGLYNGKDEKNKIQSVINWGLFFGLIGGMIFGISLYIFSGEIAQLFSTDKRLITYLKFAAFAVPSFVVIKLMISFFRGFQRIKERVLFFDLGRNLLFLLFTIALGLAAFSFKNIILACSLSFTIISLALLFYFLKKKKKLLNIKSGFSWDKSIGKELVFFSLPLLFVVMMYQVLSWTDTLMIGYFSGDSAVGFYNAAKPLSGFISTGLTATLFIYTPLAAGLYAKKEFDENKTIFRTLTKWVCAFTLPLAIVFIIFADEILDFFFGNEFVIASAALQILAISYFITNVTGPNGATLTAYGKKTILMVATFGAAILNIIFNIILIPRYGFTGAAIGTGSALLITNIFRAFILYKISGIHSFSGEIIKPVSLTCLVGGGASIIGQKYLVHSIYEIALLFCIVLLIFVASIFLTDSFSKEDKHLILLAAKKLGLKNNLFTRFG